MHTNRKEINTNKSFWKSIKLFLTNKGFIESNDITLVKRTLLQLTKKYLLTYPPRHGKRKQKVFCNILTACNNHPRIASETNIILPKLIRIAADVLRFHSTSHCCNKQNYRRKDFPRLCKNSFSFSS